MVFETVLQADLSKPVQVKQLPGHFFSSDNNANKITVEVFNKGVPVNPLDGVTAYIIRNDDVTVPCTENNGCGHIDNKAWVILPSAAYATPGQISVVIKCGSTTVCAVTTYVYRTTTNAIVDPSHVIPDIEELLEKISDCEAATQNANTATLSAISATADAEAAVGSVNSAILAAQSATAQANSATTAATSATSAANTATLAATSATAGANTATQSANTATLAATSATAGANTATLAAVSATAGANSATQAAQSATAGANTATNAANSVANYLGGMTVVASTVSPDTPASATLSTESGHAKISFEIPRGESGNETIDDTAGIGDTDFVWSADKSQKTKESRAVAIVKTISETAKKIVFNDGAEGEPVSIKAEIDNQYLNGYDRPWVGGAGKNLLDDSQVKHGAYTGEHIWNSSGDYVTYEVETLPEGTYTFSTDLATCYITRYFIGSTATEVGEEQNSITFTLSATDSFTICMRKNPASDISTLTPKSMIESGSSATDYEPYSNICPISGYTVAKLYHWKNNLIPESTDTADGYLADTLINKDTGEIGESSSGINVSEYFPLDLDDNGLCWQQKSSFSTAGLHFLYRDKTLFRPAAYSNSYQKDTSIGSGYSTTWYTYDYKKNARYFRASINSSTQYVGYGQRVGDYQKSKKIKVTFPNEAGTIYGGTIEIDKYGNGTLTVTHKFVEFDGATSGKKFDNRSTQTAMDAYYNIYTDMSLMDTAKSNYATQTNAKKYGLKSSHANYYQNTTTQIGISTYINSSSNAQLQLRFPLELGIDTLEKANTWLATQYANGTPFQIVYPLKTTSTYTFTVDRIFTNDGDNGFLFDACNMTEVVYSANADYVADNAREEAQELNPSASDLITRTLLHYHCDDLCMLSAQPTDTNLRHIYLNGNYIKETLYKTGQSGSTSYSYLISKNPTRISGNVDNTISALSARPDCFVPINISNSRDLYVNIQRVFTNTAEGGTRGSSSILIATLNETTKEVSYSRFAVSATNGLPNVPYASASDYNLTKNLPQLRENKNIAVIYLSNFPTCEMETLINFYYEKLGTFYGYNISTNIINDEAEKAYEVGELLTFHGDLYKVVSPIAIGETIDDGENGNVVSTCIADELAAIWAAINNNNN